VATRERLEADLTIAEDELASVVAYIANRNGNVAKARAYLPTARAHYVKTLAALSRFNRAEGKSVSYRSEPKGAIRESTHD